MFTRSRKRRKSQLDKKWWSEYDRRLYEWLKEGEADGYVKQRVAIAELEYRCQRDKVLPWLAFACGVVAGLLYAAITF